MKDANDLLYECRRASNVKASFEALDALLWRGGVLPDDWSQAPRDGIQRALEAWAVWRVGQCDFPQGLSEAECALLAALDIHVHSEPASAIPTP